MKNINTRISNRVYPPLKCKQCKEDFIPTDARQVFCCAQHRIDYNNDQRVIKNAPLKKINIGLSKNEAILEKGYLFMQAHKKNTIAIDFLQFDGYDFTVPCETSKSNTGNKIEWQLSYGLEGVDMVNKLFKIHKK